MQNCFLTSNSAKHFNEFMSETACFQQLTSTIPFTAVLETVQTFMAILSKSFMLYATNTSV